MWVADVEADRSPPRLAVPPDDAFALRRVLVCERRDGHAVAAEREGLARVREGERGDVDDGQVSNDRLGGGGIGRDGDGPRRTVVRDRDDRLAVGQTPVRRVGREANDDELADVAVGRGVGVRADEAGVAGDAAGRLSAHGSDDGGNDDEDDEGLSEHGPEWPRLP
ncbi:hypothetical protein ACFQJD_05765 [Haloplanus sp. GCM10025708]|uniref:hypothetical protein n=1 Tax=Haloplanus sp. GCM10025708 TaxID=3252679 RepID=UPI00361F15C8